MIKPRQRESWIDQLTDWKIKYPFSFVPSLPGEKMKPQRVIQELDRQCAHMKERVIISTGVGCHQMFAAQHYRWRVISITLSLILLVPSKLCYKWWFRHNGFRVSLKQKNK